MADTGSLMIKGAVIFGSDRSASLSCAMQQVAAANPRRDLHIYDTPKTLSFVPGDDPRDWRVSHPLPDRWFIHWDDL